MGCGRNGEEVEAGKGRRGSTLGSVSQAEVFVESASCVGACARLAVSVCLSVSVCVCVSVSDGRPTHGYPGLVPRAQALQKITTHLSRKG